MQIRALVVLALLLAGCSSLGPHGSPLGDSALGPPASLALCAYLDDGVSAERAAALLDEAWRDEAPRYGLAIRLVRATPWKRPAFAAGGIMAALVRERVAPPCDRLLAFVGRHAGDVLWGLFLPQALGGVDAATRTRGYVVARAVTPDQAFVSPSAALRHELYHMLGCDHELPLGTCYARIAALKRAYREGVAPVWDRSLGWITPVAGQVAGRAEAPLGVE